MLWHRDRLDRELGRGTDPKASEALELRAAQLLSARPRLAASVEDVLRRAVRGTRHFTVEVPVRAAEVRACADDFVALARRLRDDEPIDVQGAALTMRLLTDGASPLYLGGDHTLRYAVRAARLALDPIGTTVHQEDLAAAA